MNRRIPDLWLEQYALGELSVERRRIVEETLGDALPGELARIQASNEAILADLPPRVFASRVRTSAAPRRASVWLVPILAAAVALLVAAPLALRDTGPTVEVTRAKGSAMLQVHRQVGDDAEPLASGDLAEAGDVLQVSYTSGGAEFGAIGSIDGNGVVTWHLPLRGHRSVTLLAGNGVPLAQSYELDDAPDRERFFFVTSPAPFTLDAVEEAVVDWEVGTELQLIAPLRTTMFTVRKDP
jgi:hypothetical protein